MRFSQLADLINGFTGPRPAGVRLGQWAFNLLSETDQDIANEILGTSCDPYSDDKKIPDFIRRLLDFVEMDEIEP